MSSAVTGVSAISTTSTAASSTVGSGVEVGGDVGGADEGGVATATIKGQGQEVVGGVFPNNSAVLPPTPHSATLMSNQSEQSSLAITAKRSDTAPASTTANHVNRTASTSEPPVPTGAQNTLGATSQSNIHATPDHQNVAQILPPEEERKSTSRTNSNESEKASQNHQSPAAGSTPDKKVSNGAEGIPPQVQKEATSVQPLSSSAVQMSSSRSLVLPIGQVGPIESSGVGVGGGGGGGVSVSVSGGGGGGGATGGGGMSRASSEDSATATPTNPPTTATSLIPPHELAALVQSEQSIESTPAHNSQGSLESTSTSTMASQDQLSSQEVKSDKERAEKGTNGTLKKKAQRSKSKQIKLNLVEMTDEKVVKCTLVTGAGQMVNFQFSKNYDKPLAIFQKLVSLFYQYIRTIRRVIVLPLMTGISPSPIMPILLLYCTRDLF
jgi:hypothetical protein